MMLDLPTRERRAVVAGATLMIAIVALGRGLPLCLLWRRHELSASAQASTDLALAESVVRDDRGVSDALAARKRSIQSLRSTWLAGETPSGGGATLASLLSSAAARTGLTLGPIDVQADSVPIGSFSTATAHTSLTGDVQEVMEFLSILERGPVRVSICALAIVPVDVAAPADRPEVLHTGLCVQGLVHPRDEDLDP